MADRPSIIIAMSPDTLMTAFIALSSAGRVVERVDLWKTPPRQLVGFIKGRCPAIGWWESDERGSFVFVKAAKNSTLYLAFDSNTTFESRQQFIREIKAFSQEKM